ncbi:MAG: NUDIX domain-containing protein [Cyanobacteria bacterium P01_F01_bin.150]
MSTPKPQRTRVAAYGLVTHTNQILLCKISPILPRWVGQWTLPGGGIDFGEDPQDAMVREVEEETGLIVVPQTVATIHSLYADDPHEEFHGIRILYHTHIAGGTLRDEVNGTTDQCRWFTQSELASVELVDLAQIGSQIIFGD